MSKIYIQKPGEIPGAMILEEMKEREELEKTKLKQKQQTGLLSL